MAVTAIKEQQEDNMIITNIRSLIKKFGVSEAEVSRKTGIPQPTLHKILSGRTSDPRISTIKLIADYFDVPLDLLCSNSVILGNRHNPRPKLVPIISWHDCLDYQAAISSSEDFVITADHGNELIFALSSKPCMEPFFHKDTVLIVDPAKTPQDGDIVIVDYVGAGEAALRVLSIDGPSKLICSIRDNSISEALSDDIKVLGVVIRSMYSYR